MLFYRARLEGPAAVLDVSLSPVRPVRATQSRGAGAGPVAPTGLQGRVRVALRYGPAAGPVRTHRGWLYTDLPPGRCLRVAGCQVDGGEVLLSLAPVPAGAGRERLRDRFRLPFHLTSWGVEAVTGVRTELFCIATVRPGTLVLRGRGLVVLETPSVRLVREGEVVQEAASGDGPISALYHAIDRAARFEGQLLDYRLNAVTGGQDALGEVTVRVRSGDRVASGRGTSTDVLEASARAYMNAINKILSGAALAVADDPAPGWQMRAYGD